MKEGERADAHNDVHVLLHGHLFAKKAFRPPLKPTPSGGHSFDVVEVNKLAVFDVQQVNGAYDSVTFSVIGNF